MSHMMHLAEGASQKVHLEYLCVFAVFMEMEGTNIVYTAYEGLNLPNQNRRNLGVFSI